MLENIANYKTNKLYLDKNTYYNIQYNTNISEHVINLYILPYMQMKH